MKTRKLSFVPKAQPEISQTRSVWNTASNGRRPEGTAGASGGSLQRFNASTLQRRSEDAVALIITLILLAVTLVMAIAFLAVSRRERGSVSTTEAAAAAKYAMNAGEHNAEARIVTQMLMTTNPYVFGLLVSTNYVNRDGFNPDEDRNLTNVNYDYYDGKSGPLSAQDLQYNIANLYYSPRPPVYYSNDFRFYLDLNRNGMYDTNGWVELMDNSGNPILTVSNTPIYRLEVGDPEWIGVLEHPDQPHGPNNPFIARYCFIAVPANSLDMNYIHNETFSSLNGDRLSVASDDYFRNQGVGTWELNLAAFLADLNTNIWDPQNGGLEYQYLRPGGFPNNGVAFNDAFDLLTYRYSDSYPSQSTVQNLFGARGDNAFEYNGIDGYTLGPLQTAFDWNYTPGNVYNDDWAGAENTNNIFTPDDLYNSNKTVNFAIHLQNAGVNVKDAEGNAGTSVSTYDRYTFYRLLAQMGTDTKPAQGKINLNYTNAIVNYDYYGAATSIAISANAETNFVPWRPQDFFTVAANQMLKEYTTEWFEESPSNYMQTYYGYYGNFIAAPVSGFISFTNFNGLNVTNIQYLGQTNQIPSFGLTNIPVYMNGTYVYSPAVNRILQLAANIYDASTNTSTFVNPNCPSAFRPIFWKTNEYNYFLGRYFTNIYIKGYQYVQEPLIANTTYANAVLSTPFELTDLPFGESVSNIWGIPMIIGAKKGLPNFNGFELVSTFFIERELQFNRNENTPQAPGGLFPFGRTYTTNQQYVMGISNTFTMEDWNSYANQYNNQVTIYAQDQLGLGLTNSDTPFGVANNFLTNANLTLQPWTSQLYALPFGSNVTVLQNLSYYPSPPSTNNLYTYFKTPGASHAYGGIAFTAPCFIPNSLDPDNYLDSGTPPMPQFGMMQTNHLQAYMLDTSQGQSLYILDFVQLGSMNNNVNINAAIDDPPDGSGLWSTNAYTGTITPWGVINQYMVSSGYGSGVPAEDQDGGGAGGTWATTPVPGAGPVTTPAAQQAYCAAFFSANDTAPSPIGGWVTNMLLHYQAPFTPMRQIVQRYVLQANDPLVHYLASDLNDIGDDSTNKVAIGTAVGNVTYIKYVNKQLSDRYLPWGNEPPGAAPSLGNSPQMKPSSLNTIPVDQNAYNWGYKDPLVWSSDNWDFPTNKYPTVGWLGRVHRGTPWQSVYLKSTNIVSLYTSINGGPLLPTGMATWQVWTGDMNADDAWNEIPAQDRLLFDLFTAAPDDDAMRGQVSVNIGADDPTNELAGLASWSALLSGTVVFTANRSENDMVMGIHPGYQDPVYVWRQSAPYYDLYTNQPLGALAYPPSNAGSGWDMTNAAMWQIVRGINSTRTNFTSIDGLHGVFEHVGDILATPQLSDGSPFLETSDGGQVNDGMSDEMYEWLPQQMLGLMTASGTAQNPPRYVIYCYGQALKPAVNGIVTSGTFTGLCTNYQVVAESASRVVIRVDNTPTPANSTATPHVVVEQFNTLPPD